MNDKKKNHSFNKKLGKGPMLKFSNTVLFERRERNYNLEENNKANNQKTFNKTHKLFRKKINKKSKEDLAVQFCKTMSSFYQSEKTSNILPLLDYFEKNIKTKKKKKIHLDNLICKTERNYREKDLFKTEISLLTTKNNKNVNKYYFKNKNSNKQIKTENNKNSSNIDVLLLFQSQRNQNKTNINNPNLKLNIESYITKDKSNYKDYPYAKTERNQNLWDKNSEEYANYDFDIKSYKYEQKFNAKNYLNKLNEEKIIIHTNKAKSERLTRLVEGSQNQIEFYEDSISSFINSKKLLENNFVNKVGDYSKFISTKREREKIKQSLLRQKIMDLRKEIEQIRAKINKIEIEKKNIIKWIYLQIQMKEKILKVPQHYKNIITNYGIDKSSKKLLLRSEDKDSSSDNKKGGYKKAILKIKDSFALKFFKSKDSFNIFGNIGNDEKSNEKRKIRIQEHRRILSYKNNLIYKTPEEFNDRLTSLEKGNLVLLQYKDIVNSQLFKYKRELESLIKERNKFEIENQKIGGWENELKIIKKMADENTKIVSLFKTNKINNLKTNVEKNSEKDEKLKSNINGKNDDKYKYKKASLFKSIYNIFENCQTVQTHLKYASEILNQVDRKMNTKEKEMLLMLEFIEQTSDYLIMSINKKMNQNNEIKAFIKTIKSNIEKEHKLEKAKIQMMLDMKNAQFLKEKVSKRYNKIYFLPKRKADLYEFKIKKQETSSNKRIFKKDNIQDYLYDEESSKE